MGGMVWRTFEPKALSVTDQAEWETITGLSFSQ